MSAALRQLLQQIANPGLMSPFDEAYDLALANSLAADERRTLGDEDDSVRSTAWEHLVDAYGLRPLIAGPDGKRASTTHIELAKALLGSEIVAFERMGIREAQWVFRRLDAGIEPSSLGIAYVAEQPGVFDRLRRVLFQEGEPFPLEDIARLSGIQRRYAELMIAMRLERDDARAPSPSPPTTRRAALGEHLRREHMPFPARRRPPRGASPRHRHGRLLSR